MSKQYVPAKLKRAAIERAQGCCEYCRSQARFAMQPFSIEHIKPLHAGGKTTFANLALACEGCNSHKHAKTRAFDPITGKVVPLYHPRRLKWHKHFTWNADFTLIVGLTPTGRATVEALQMNRDGVINLRRALRYIGKHPLE